MDQLIQVARPHPQYFFGRIAQHVQTPAVDRQVSLLQAVVEVNFRRDVENVVQKRIASRWRDQTRLVARQLHDRPITIDACDHGTACRRQEPSVHAQLIWSLLSQATAPVLPQLVCGRPSQRSPTSLPDFKLKWAAVDGHSRFGEQVHLTAYVRGCEGTKSQR
jgi:hypothetical protein